MVIPVAIPNCCPTADHHCAVNIAIAGGNTPRRGAVATSSQPNGTLMSVPQRECGRAFLHLWDSPRGLQAPHGQSLHRIQDMGGPENRSRPTLGLLFQPISTEALPCTRLGHRHPKRGLVCTRRPGRLERSGHPKAPLLGQRREQQGIAN